MWSQKIGYQDALSFVKSKRPIIKPNSGFVKELIYYESIKDIIDHSDC